MSARLPVENSDTVSLVCALLVRYPEIASMRCTPGEGTVRFTFAVSAALDKATQRAFVGGDRVARRGLSRALRRERRASGSSASPTAR